MGKRTSSKEITVQGPRNRTATHGKLAGPQGSHEGSGRRGFRGCLQGWNRSRGVHKVRGHEVRSQEAGRLQVQVTRGRNFICASQGGWWVRRRVQQEVEESRRR